MPFEMMSGGLGNGEIKRLVLWGGGGGKGIFLILYYVLRVTEHGGIFGINF